MPNTVISLKKASASGAIPSALANGEIGLDHFTGNLWFKAANGSYKLINPAAAAGGQSPDFGTVNASGTLVVSDTQGSILTLISGGGIEILGFAANDTIRISDTKTLARAIIIARGYNYP